MDHSCAVYISFYTQCNLLFMIGLLSKPINPMKTWGVAENVGYRTPTPGFDSREGCLFPTGLDPTPDIPAIGPPRNHWSKIKTTSPSSTLSIIEDEVTNSLHIRVYSA